LKELGYRSDEDVISAWESGNYSYYDSVMSNETQITLDQLRDKVGKSDFVEKPTYPCMMEVWNDFEEPEVRQVIADFKTPKGHDMYVAISEEGYYSYCWQHARPIQPDPLKEVVEKLKNNSVTLTPNEAQLIIDALEKIEK
jgi:hypothetical protein